MKGRAPTLPRGHPFKARAATHTRGHRMFGEYLGLTCSPVFWCSSPTTPDALSASGRIRVTHPFHPLSGQEFVLVAERSSRHGEQVWYERGDGSVASIPQAWTDLAAPDPFTALAGGRAHFLLESLTELAELIAAIRNGADQEGGKHV